MHTQVPLDGIGRLVAGRHENPAELLGPHPVEYQGRKAIAVRAFVPDSSQVWLVDQPEDAPRPMRRLHPAGFYEAICPLDNEQVSSNYRLKVAHNSGEVTIMSDPYAVEPLLQELDRYLLGEGRHYELYKRLGAQLRTVDGIDGVNFSVWAPNAKTVQVVGDFNNWDGVLHAMKVHPNLGVWELFIPDVKPGDIYKYRILQQDGQWNDKSDPLGFAAELPPRTASVVTELDTHTWQDNAWMESRRESNQLEKPFNIYEVHLGSWQQGGDQEHGWLNYRDLAHRLVDYCKEMNFTHLELMPISEHPFTGSWGYQTVGYFAATSRYGTPEDFMYFVDHCHQNGIGVILDWVPAHYPKDGHGLAHFDGSALYEHADPRQGEHPDWGTNIFNYGRNEVRNFLISNALFWLDKYHIDGLRVDAVASMLYLDYSREAGEWIPNEHGGRENLAAIDFLREFNVVVHEKFPGAVTIAEESTAWGGVSRPTYDGGLGFTFKWNMGWMNDTLDYFHNDPIHRSHHHDELTFSLIYAFTENFTLPLSHDEVVHGKGALLSQMPGDLWQKFANLRLLYSYMWTHPGKKLLFMGGEFGQWNEWNEDGPIQWELLDFDTHRGIQNLVRDLNKLVVENPALHHDDFTAAGFEWVDCMNATDSVLAYVRKADGFGPALMVCANFTPVVRKDHHVGVTQSGRWTEIFNSDAAIYGGSGIVNPGMTQSLGIPHHGRDDSIKIDLPPLGIVVLKHEA
ncbi:1,4-alpha-glucan branching enzyme GlgB [Rosistilla ulvae]|uniref:1,4-alpha-glucan branching enzyme GlgB n=1 Tax=Rosistilla ulvae TaxID=1930277 RepID=A0A517M048_9BACT|nr:1,4-alpha-glucan branching protein GlgB [Rosistilla ulvae]QDS88241.1 1,4-alpha-glucan branching enzyme GlgB [Rosistilla ulvae]